MCEARDSRLLLRRVVGRDGLACARSVVHQRMHVVCLDTTSAKVKDVRGCCWFSDSAGAGRNLLASEPDRTNGKSG